MILIIKLYFANKEIIRKSPKSIIFRVQVKHLFPRQPFTHVLVVALLVYHVVTPLRTILYPRGPGDISHYFTRANFLTPSFSVTPLALASAM